MNTFQTKEQETDTPATYICNIKNDNIVCQVVNTEANKNKLADMPHKDINDELSIVYKMILKVNDDNEIITLPMTYENINEFTNMDITDVEFRSELHDMAIDNTKTILPPKITLFPNETDIDPCDIHANEKFIKFIKTEFNDISDISDTLFDSHDIIIITNKYGFWGANNIINTEIFDEICDRANRDSIAVIPSSIHELLIVKSGVEPSEYIGMADMIKEINQSKVAENDRLSNNLYLYSKARGLSLLSNEEKNTSK